MKHSTKLLQDEFVQLNFFQVANLPLVIKERDVRYQFSRIVLYRKLLQGYPFKRPLIWKEPEL